MTQVLVVDDSAVIRKVARRILEGLQFETAEAEDGKVAHAPPRCRTRSCSTGTCRSWTGSNFYANCAACPRAANRKSSSARPKTTLRTSLAPCTAGADEYIMKPFDKHIVQSKF